MKAWWPSRTDIALACAVAVIGLLDTIFGASGRVMQSGLTMSQPNTGAMLIAFCSGIALVLRRRFPMGVAIAVTIGYVVVSHQAFSPLALMIATYSMSAYSPCKPRLWLCAGGLAVLWLMPWPQTNDAVDLLAFVAMPLLAGRLSALRLNLMRELARRSAFAVRERALLVDRIRAEERRRIAREMHDVVAHQVSHIVLSAGALELTAQKGPAIAPNEIGKIRIMGIKALDELRAVVGILTRDDERAPRRPAAGITDLDKVVGDAASIGTPVMLDVRGTPYQPSPAVNYAVYRVVEEALTNIAKHAPGASTSVDVRFSTDRLEVSVTNQRPMHSTVLVPGGGNGLIGIEERVKLLGGRFHAGPMSGGGFRVLVGFPRSAESVGAIG